MSATVAQVNDGVVGDGSLDSRFIVGMRVDATTYDDACSRIFQWARDRRQAYVCAASVNNVMQAHDDASFERVMNDATLVTPDGMPLVWGLRALGVRGATRVYGPNLTLELCKRSVTERVPVGLLGGTDQALKSAVVNLQRMFPGVDIRYAYSPPFRALSDLEAAEIRRRVDESEVGILFVGLGCPAQERWMASNYRSIRPVLIGVGAAFDFIAGTKKQAPPPLQRLGLEWLFRLVSEPRRLWRRYLYNNPRFVALFALQLVRYSIGRRR